MGLSEKISFGAATGLGVVMLLYGNVLQAVGGLASGNAMFSLLASLLFGLFLLGLGIVGLKSISPGDTEHLMHFDLDIIGVLLIALAGLSLGLALVFENVGSLWPMLNFLGAGNIALLKLLGVGFAALGIIGVNFHWAENGLNAAKG